MRKKAFDIIERIVLVRPEEKGLRLWWRKIQAAIQNRHLVYLSDVWDLVPQIYNNHVTRFFDALWFLPPEGGCKDYSHYLPAGNYQIKQHLRKSIYDHGLKVLRRTPQGKVESGLWLIKITPTFVHLALYLKPSCEFRGKNEANNL